MFARDAVMIAAVYLVWLGAAYAVNALATGAGTPQALFESWVRFDGIYFRAIAEHGYAEASRLTRPQIGFTYLAAFFPLFPLAVHFGAGMLNGNYSAATIAVPQMFTYLAVLALFKLVALDFPRAVAWLSVLSLIVFPTSYFLISGYSESLFLLLAVLACYCYRRRQFLGAGAAGALASTARIIGPIIFLAILVDAAWREWRAAGGKRQVLKSHIAHRTSQIASLALIPLGLVAYVAYLWWAFGNPALFLQGHASPEWRVGLDLTGPIKGLLLPFFTLAFRDPSSEVFRQNLFNAFFFYVAIGMLVYAWRKMPPAYSLYGLLAIFVPALSGSLISMPRYLLVSFPLFIGMGLMLAEHPRLRLLLAPLALSSLAATYLFFRTVFLG